jgi:hypothetical protein
LGYITRQLARQIHCPIYAQWEVRNAIHQQDAKMPIVYTATLQDKDYITTKDVLSQFLTENPGEKVAIIAHPHHQLRCGMNAVEMGLKVTYPDVTKFLPPDGWNTFGCDAYGYWSESVQPWTRRWEDYYIADLQSRLKDYREKRENTSQ